MTSLYDLQSHSEPPSGGYRVEAEPPARERSRHAPNPIGRLDYIDTLRGAAAVQVLLSHAMLAFFPSLFFASPLSGALVGYIAATPLFFVFDGASAVCIFFVLSGYVLTPLFMRSQATSAALIVSRFARLGAPALAACALSAAAYQLFSGYSEAAALLSHSQWLADNWRPDADLWFVKDAFVNGILVGFRNASIVQWFGWPASALPSMYDSYVAPLWTLSMEFYGSILVLILARSRSWTLAIAASVILSRTYLICFIIGHVAARYNLGGRRPAAHWLWMAAAAMSGVLICMASHFWTPSLVLKACVLSRQILPPCPIENPAYLMRVYGAAIFTLAVMQCSPIRAFLSQRALRSLGRLSFPIYLTHWPVIFGAGSFLLVTLAPWVGPNIARCVALLASVGLTAFAAMYFERVDQFALTLSRVLRRGKAERASESP